MKSRRTKDGREGKGGRKGGGGEEERGVLFNKGETSSSEHP